MSNELKEIFATIDADLIALDNLFPFAPKSAKGKAARKRLDDHAWNVERARTRVLGEPKRKPIHIMR